MVRSQLWDMMMSMDVQVRYDGTLVARVDRVGSIVSDLVESVMPLNLIENEIPVRSYSQPRVKSIHTSAVTVAPAGTLITAVETGWW